MLFSSTSPFLGIYSSEALHTRRWKMYREVYSSCVNDCMKLKIFLSSPSTGEWIHCRIFIQWNYLSFLFFTFFNPLSDLSTELQLDIELPIFMINFPQLVVLTFYAIENSLYLEMYFKWYAVDFPGFNLSSNILNSMPRVENIFRDICTPMFSAALFTVAINVPWWMLE